jgi:phosphoribosyl-ATP pyrophosphohydrolase
MNPANSILAHLMTVIQDRKANPSANSYTNRLLSGGVDKIGAKIVEEATEVVAAAAEAGEEGRRHTIHEAADLLYHLFVLLGHRNISLAEVESELERRFGTSGLAEKASRAAPPGAGKPTGC